MNLFNVPPKDLQSVALLVTSFGTLGPFFDEHPEEASKMNAFLVAQALNGTKLVSSDADMYTYLLWSLKGLSVERLLEIYVGLDEYSTEKHTEGEYVKLSKAMMNDYNALKELLGLIQEPFVCVPDSDEKLIVMSGSALDRVLFTAGQGLLLSGDPPEDS